MGQAKETAEAVQAEDRAFEESGLSELAYDVLKILERFAADSTAADALHDAAAQIDTLYTTDEDASSYWQDKSQSRKKLLRKVRRLVKDLGLPDWNAFKTHMDEFAVRHYAKP